MKVSVCIFTYNHEPFIAQAVESVLMQQADFDFEIIIGEDDSSDGTRTIVKQYQRKYPRMIRLLLHERKDVIVINGRETGRWNFMNTLASARGEYVALLEGDDYWLDVNKLQKQVDFLDSHPDHAICFHLAQYRDMDDQPLPGIWGPRRIKPGYTVKDLFIEGNFIPTASTLFRNGLIQGFPSWFSRIPVGDWPLNILNAQHGDIGFINEVMSAYRVHTGGVSSMKNRIDKLRSRLEMFRFFNRLFNHRYNRQIRQGMSHVICNLAFEYEEGGDLQQARKNAWRGLLQYPVRGDIIWQEIKMIVRTTFPPLYKFLKRTKGKYRNESFHP